MILNQKRLREGVQYLAGRDESLESIVAAYGPPPLWDRKPGFETLLRIILEQQVSLQSAKAAYEKLLRHLGRLTPKRFLTLSDAELKKIGFSRQKTRYGRELSRAILRSQIDLNGLNRLEDGAVRQELIKIKGIGPWTADIYLLMAMGRPDIWPNGDLAIATAVQRLYDWSKKPTNEELIAMSRKWRPWRSVAARLFWHFYLSTNKRK